MHWLLARRNQSTRWLVIWLIGALIFAFIFTAVRREESDTRVYRLAALRFLNGQQIYRPSDKAAFTYPPFFVLAYIPFALLPQPWDRTAWCFSNVLLLGYVLAVLRQLIDAAIPTSGPQWWRRPAIAYGLIGLLSLRFVITPIEYQGHDLIVFALFMTAMQAMWKENAGRSGVWAGLAAACKATPLLLTAAFFWQRRWRALLVCLLTVVVVSLVPDLLVTNPARCLWVQSWHDKFLSHVDAASAPDAAGAWTAWNMMNQSLSGTLYRLFTRLTHPTIHSWDISLLALTARQLFLVTGAAKLSVLLLVSYAVWPRPHIPEHRGALAVLTHAAAVLLGMLLLSPMSSKQHFCVLVIPITVLVLDWLYGGGSRVVAVALAITLGLGTLAGKDIIGDRAHLQLAAYGSLTFCTLGLLIACCDVARRLAVRPPLIPAANASVSQTYSRRFGRSRSQNRPCEELAP